MDANRLLSALLFLYVLKGGLGASDEIRILESLLKDYNPSVRPVHDSSEVVNVAIDITLAQITRVDTRNQRVITNLWVRLYWKDDHLAWNSSDYGNITDIVMPSTGIWRPDIVLYNRIEADESSDIPDTNVVVQSTGEVKWAYPVSVMSTCLMDVFRFPFDEQNCPLKFGLWAYDGRKFNVTNRKDKGDTSSFTRNEEWDLLNLTAQRNEVLYACCSTPYPDVTFTIYIRRQAGYYLYNVITPCMIMTLIGLLGFCLPVDCGEKLAAVITMLLSLIVFAQIMSDILPITSRSIPIIGRFFGFMVLIVALASAMTIMVLNLHYRGPNPAPVPQWLRTLVKTVTRAGKKNGGEVYEPQKTELNGRVKSDSGINVNYMTTPGNYEKVYRYNEQSTMFLRQLQDQTSMLKRLVDKQKEAEADVVIRNEWQKTAVVIDRLLFALFLVIVPIASVAIYMYR